MLHCGVVAVPHDLVGKRSQVIADTIIQCLFYAVYGENITEY